MIQARRSIEIQLRRLGQEVPYYVKMQTGTDAHNNPAWSYEQETETDSDGNVVPVTLPCLRSYPNRNEQHDTAAGPYEDDDPVFIFLPGAAPPSDARIEYTEPTGTTTTYEMRAPTRYETHVAMFGAFVSE